MEGPRARDKRPCDNCRRRRIRCLFASDAALNCVLCVSRDTNCTYLESAARKKRPASPSVDKGESAGIRARPRPKAQKSIDASAVSDYANLPGRSLLKETLGHQNRQSSEVVGATADFDASLTESLLWSPKGECILKPPQILRRPNESTFFLVTPDAREDAAADLADLDDIEAFVAPHGPELVNLYFRIVHPSFPILHKKVFLEKYGRSYRESTPTGLGAVYIMALNWWSYSPGLASQEKPDSKQLEAKVLRMLCKVHKRPKISDLQGGLVLMQSPNATSWAMTGHLVAMAQNLGINADCSDWRVPDWERGVRKRVAWALFMQDAWGALVYGRASHIQPDDWDVQPLTASDFPETAIDDDDEEGSAEIEKGKQTFLHMVSLTEIVSRVLNQFFTLKAVRRQQSLQNVLEVAKPLQLELKAWYAGLPPILSIDETVPRKLSSVGYLHLAYFTAEVTLHRAILRSHGLASNEYTLLSVTRLAAATRLSAALDFVKRLKGEHLQSYWYFSSSVSLSIIGMFAAILRDCAGDANPDERQSYVTQLAEYRWILRVSAKSADFIGAALGLLDARTPLLEQQQQQQGASPQQNRSNGPIFSSPGESYQVSQSQGSPPQQFPEGDDLISPTTQAGFIASPRGEPEPWPQNYDLDNPYYSIDWGDLGGYTPAGQ